ncbi:conserved Plasmodium protein, unknown function [Plasmodium ovale curtisi]|uniref:Uncharacterized protein n=1 Tax=Plasmodium ovale curtisi TaxID=864141 RepID=A0A1A8X0Q4_PLAOA|nr:conserved Plasmodium protein, unknown function [Plasmodium ovale curtisi]
MKKDQFFHIVENDDLLSLNQNSLRNLSVNSSVDFKNEEEKKKKNFEKNEISDAADDILHNVAKRNALNFLGLGKKKEKIEKYSCEKGVHEKSTPCAHIARVRIKEKNGNEVYPDCAECENRMQNGMQSGMQSCMQRGTQKHSLNVTPNDMAFYAPLVPTLCNDYGNGEGVTQGGLVKDKTVLNRVEEKGNSEFYCLEQIVHNNLNNRYDKDEIKIFHIYHDNRAECLFNDISIIKFYGNKNICIYQNKNFIYNEINTNLFQHEKEKEKKMSFNIGTEDIYEYLYKEKIKLNEKKDVHSVSEKINIEKDNAYCPKQVQYIQFYIHKYPYFLKEKIKIFIHIYNMFSVHPYINHKFIEENIYSKNVKISYNFEKKLHIKWYYYNENILKKMLTNVLEKKKEQNFEDNFVKMNDFLYINFLTQEIRVHDIHNSESDDTNYILLNGNGLSFSAYYHVMVPNYKNVSESVSTVYPHAIESDYQYTHKKGKTTGDIACSIGCNIDRDSVCNSNYNLNYEYVQLSQLFNIYDDFHICFLYPLFVSYFFFYNLFLEDKSKKVVASLPGRNNLTHKQLENGNDHGEKYSNTREESYISQLNDIYVKLRNCFKKLILDTKNCDVKIEDNVIQFLMPQSCFKNFENVEFVCDTTHNLPLLYVVCISKYGLDNAKKLRDIDASYHDGWRNGDPHGGNKHTHNSHGNCIYTTRNNANCIGGAIIRDTYHGGTSLMGSVNIDHYDGAIINRKEYSNDRITMEAHSAVEKSRWCLHENLLCSNEITEVNNLRTIFPEDMKDYFNTCNKIDNIIKVSVRNDGVCFFYVKNIVNEYIFFSYFIIFNSVENLFQLMNKGKNKKCDDNVEHAEYATSVEYLERDKIKNYSFALPPFNKNELLHSVMSPECALDKSILLKGSHKSNANSYALNEINLLNNFTNDTDQNYKCFLSPNFKLNESETSTCAFKNVYRVFEMNNIKNVYNDFYICENKRVNTFKLVNIMNREKKKILTSYYFDMSELTPLFFLRVSNIHIYDINKQLNTLFEYINYNNKTFTPFLEKYGKYEMNVQLDLLENMYNINNELYLLYSKKINYSHDIYKYNYLYVMDYLLKKYVLYNNIYFNIYDELKKNEYYKLRYTNKNKETISIHFTVSFNYVFDENASHFKLTPQHYITHIEQNAGENFKEGNYITFINNYVNSKYLK